MKYKIEAYWTPPAESEFVLIRRINSESQNISHEAGHTNYGRQE